MTRLRTVAGDSWMMSVAILAAWAATGLIMIHLGWRGAAAQINVFDQVPYVVSGAYGGVALLGFALGGLAIQARRRAEAHRRAELAQLTAAIAGLTSAVRGGRR